MYVGIKIPKYVTSWVAQRQLPDFIEKLYHATRKYAERKMDMKWRSTYPSLEWSQSDVRIDDFDDEEVMEDNVAPANRKSSEPTICSNERDENEESEEKEEMAQSRFSSWWSYFVPNNYLH